MDALPISRAYEDTIYQLARAGYIRKSIASGEYLFRIGEILQAKKTFKELMDYDDTIVEAHRGYIKCAAALKQIDPLLESYQKASLEEPDNPILIYATGLCLTYKNEKSPLFEARDLIKKSILLNGQIEYFHQTLGYIYETLESVYGENELLELALDSYRKAYFLNDQTTNPDNTANLILNLGNTYFNLKQYGKAFDFYDNRLRTEKPFDNVNTEIQFYRHLGMCAFQINDSEKTIQAFEMAIQIIDSHVDPFKSSKDFDGINRYIMDQIVTPLQKTDKLRKSANDLALSQTQINEKLSNLTDTVLPPPSPEWMSFEKNMGLLLDHQERVNKMATALVKKKKDFTPSYDAIRNTLALRILKVKESLRFPRRLIELKAEMLDRLGLAYQDAGNYSKAIETFESVYSLNKNLNKNENLAAGKRSKAYNTYLLAGTQTGERKMELLKTAEDDFKEVLRLIDAYGVSQKRDTQRDALIDLSIQVSTDNTTSSTAAFGFSEDQEKRLAEAFLFRINLEHGDVSEAESTISEQIKQYPDMEKVSEKDMYGVSLLYHRAGLIKNASQKYSQAFSCFKKAAMLSLKMENPVSSAMNVENLAIVLMKIPHNENRLNLINEFVGLKKQVTDLLKKYPPASQQSVSASFHNSMGVFLMSEFSRDSLKPKHAPAVDKSTGEIKSPQFIQHMDKKIKEINSLKSAGFHFMKGIRPLEGAFDTLNRDNKALLGSLNLNMGSVAAHLREADHAAAFYEKALNISREILKTDIMWRAQLGLHKYDEALEILETLTVLESGCSENQIIHPFSNMMMDKVNAGDIEGAFNFSEKISELERFNRTAYIFKQLPESAKKICRRVYPRIQKINALKKELKGKKGEDKAFILKQIHGERKLVHLRVGDAYEKLPKIIENIYDPFLRDTIIVLIGMASHAMDVAESNDKNKEEVYHNLLKTYHKIRLSAIEKRPGDKGADMITFMGPEPFEAIDVQESLEPGDVFLRIVPVGPPVLNGDYLLFAVTPDEITVKKITSLSDVWAVISKEKSSNYYLSIDNLRYNLVDHPDLFSRVPIALNASHFVRTFMSRKPFKSNTLYPFSIETFQKRDAFSLLPNDTLYGTGKNLKTNLVNIHTLLMSDGNTLIAESVPVREGDFPKRQLAYINNEKKAVDLEAVLMNADNLSVALFPNVQEKDVYIAGHMAGILGCPSVIISNGVSDHEIFINSFLDAYENNNVDEALRIVNKLTEIKGKTYLLGYRGMSEKAAMAYAGKHFKKWVKKAQSAYKENRAVEAMMYFENSIQIANQVKKYRRYLPALYRFSRESAYKMGDLSKAREYAKRLSDQMEKTKPDSEAHAESLLRLGLILARQQKYEAAISVLKSAVEILDQLELAPKHALALSDLGIVLENATEYDQALDIFQSAAFISESIGKDQLLAKQHTNLGRIFDLRLNRFYKAIQEYQKALLIYQEEENPEAAAQAYLDIGRCYRLLGNFNEAEARYKMAFEKSSDMEMQAKIIIEQANNAWFQANYEKAFRLQRKAYKISKEFQLPLLEVIALNTSGLTFWTLGKHQKALKELNTALSIARKIKGREDEVASTLNNIGIIYREMGNYPRALGVFHEALDIDEQLKSEWAISYDLRNMAQTYIKSGKVEKAIPLLKTAIEKAASIGNRINEAKAILGLANAHELLGKNGEAENFFQKALTLSRSMGMKEVEWRALYGLSKLVLHVDREKAENLLRQSVEIIETMRSDIKIEQLKDSFIENKLSVYETLVMLLADKGDITGAFEMAERSRARNFIDLLGNQKLSLHSATDQKFYEQEKSLRTRMDEYRALILHETDPDAKKEYQNLFDDLNNDYDNLMLDIQTSNPELSSMVTINPVKTSQLQEKLEPGITLLTYYILPKEILCWVIKNNAIELIRTPLGRETLVQTILNFRRAIQNIEPLELQSNKLYSWLLSPVIPHIEDSKVLGVIPHGPLHYVSFGTLSHQGRYVIDTYPIFYLPSASVLNYTTGRRAEKVNFNVLAIGNPDLKNPLLDLPFAEQEVGSMKWNFNDITILTKEKATKKWVLDNIEKYGIIHMASHGEFNPINPLFSAIKLAPDQKTNGDLEAAEVFSLKINADMVFLSACQTGIGKVLLGDDVIGLNRAFFYAGTHTVISSLWRVSDVSTAILIKQFYRQFVRNNKAQSLQDAILHVKKRYPHPGYWGAFTLVGDYR